MSGREPARRSRFRRLLTVASLLALPALVGAGAPARHPTAGARHEPPPETLERDTLARVGARAITALDLVQRLEWMPFVEKASGANMDSVRAHALESMIGEALLAQESEHRTPPPGWARMREALRRALSRDALFRDVGRGAAPPTPARIDSAVRQSLPYTPPQRRRALRQAVADSLRDLDARERAAAFMIHTLAGHEARLDSLLFMRLADSLRVIVGERGEQAIDSTWIPPTEASDLLLVRLEPWLGQPLATLPGGALLLGDAIEDLRFYVYGFRSLQRHRFAAQLSLHLRALIEGELMAREAIRRGFDRRPDVRRDLALWTNAWRARDAVARLTAHVAAPEDDAFRVFAMADPERAKRVSEVDLEEILSPTEREANEARERLASGARFAALAPRLSHRAAWAARGGRSGFFPVLAHEELGWAALLSPADSLLGPVRLPEGWSVYRVLGKRLLPDSGGVGPALQAARSEALAERRADVVARHIASIADVTPVRIDWPAVQRVEITPTNMVVRRSLGYGGGMLAAPSLLPLDPWMAYWRGAVKPLP
ncbi:MAG TPA: peptidylprolyl isomerase [Candidatus Acidoferrales bacterium]|nr:peptidylprolyl isomerase [Candidatus Acidoferrales bacterium]